MIDRENEIAYEESEAQELEGLRAVLNEVKQQNKILIKEIEDYDTRINKAIEYIESYELGKYDYSIPMGGIIELKDILQGEDNVILEGNK